MPGASWTRSASRSSTRAASAATGGTPARWSEPWASWPAPTPTLASRLELVVAGPLTEAEADLMRTDVSPGPDPGRRQPAPRAGACPAARRGRAAAARLAPAHPATQLQAVRVPGERAADPRPGRGNRGGESGRGGRRRRGARRRRGGDRGGAAAPGRGPARGARRRAPSAAYSYPAVAERMAEVAEGGRGVRQSPPLLAVSDGRLRPYGAIRGQRRAGDLSLVQWRPARRRTATPDRAGRGGRRGPGPLHRARWSAPTTSAGSPTRGSRSKRALRRGRRPPRARGAAGRARRVPVHARHPPGHVPRPAVDDAPVRRLRDRRGDQPPLPLPDRARLDRALDGLRPADPARPRLRRAALPGRGRAAPGSRSTRSRTCGSASTRSRSTRSRPR